jgi:hypothetical protein
MKKLTGWRDVQQPSLLLVLFTLANKQEAWNKQGLLNLNNLSNAQQKYSKSHIHVTVIYTQDYLEKNQRLTCRSDVTTHSEKVKKNRVTLHQLIDAVCYLAISNFCSGAMMSHPHHQTKEISWNIQVLKSHGPLLENHWNSATVILWH